MVGFVVNENRARESRASRASVPSRFRFRLARFLLSSVQTRARARARPSSARHARRALARDASTASPRLPDRSRARPRGEKTREPGITAAGSRHARSRRAGRRRACVPARDGRTRRAERHASRGTRGLARIGRREALEGGSVVSSHVQGDGDERRRQRQRRRSARNLRRDCSKKPAWTVI